MKPLVTLALLTILTTNAFAHVENVEKHRQEVQEMDRTELKLELIHNYAEMISDCVGWHLIANVVFIMDWLPLTTALANKYAESVAATSGLVYSDEGESVKGKTLGGLIGSISTLFAEIANINDQNPELKQRVRQTLIENYNSSAFVRNALVTDESSLCVQKKELLDVTKKVISERFPN